MSLRFGNSSKVEYLVSLVSMVARSLNNVNYEMYSSAHKYLI